MCGIAGELKFNEQRVSQENLKRMGQALAHRGPDGDGVFTSGNGRLGFAHRRLAIVDLSANAAQPMTTLDGRYTICFNGEIYNHMDVRRELMSLGHTAWKTTHSDTEVILEAYRRWGSDCLQKLRGMFAFALWDEQERRLFIARDRVGIKPLYYYQDSDRFLFGSEIKAIFAAGGVPRKINETALFHFMTFATTPAPETLFQNIFKLPAGHFAYLDETGMQTPRRYWDFFEHQQDFSALTEDELGSQLMTELEEAVRLHKMSDVPVGVFLSGGVDSTVNALLFARDEARPVHTFTIDYASQLEAHRSEAAYATRVAEMVGAYQHTLRLNEKHLLEFLPRMIQLQDEPFADPVCIPIFYVSQLARDNNVKVCQVGEGADEIFCGYGNWMTHVKIDRWGRRFKGTGLSSLALWVLRAAGKGSTFTYEALRRSFAGELQFWAGAEAFREDHKRRLLSPRLREKFADLSSMDVISPIRKRFMQNSSDKSIVQWMTYMDFQVRLPETLLMRVDKMGMGASIEGRVPYLDHKLVQFAWNIPASYKVLGDEGKHIFKYGARNLIPAEILRRPKQGFSVPLEDWVLSDLGYKMKTDLEAFCRETDLLDASEVAKLFQEGHALQCWFLFNVAMWWKDWIKAAS